MIEKRLTREDITVNNATVIDPERNPLTIDDGEKLHVYIGISATSICSVRLRLDDNFLDYGTYKLERLSKQENMYALHLLLDEYIYYPEEPEYRESNLLLTAYTCGILSSKGEFTINQKGCERTFTISWMLNELKLIDTTRVVYGALPTHNDAERPSTARYTYEFNGWYPSVVTASTDTTYIAQFKAILRTYTIRWQNYNDSEFYTEENVPYGTTPSYTGETPSRPSTNTIVYTFTGWSPNITEITGDTTYTAQFSGAQRTYIITWVNEDNTVVLAREEYHYLDVPSYHGIGGVPPMPSDPQYTYTFIGWEPSITFVTEDKTYKAKFRRTPFRYIVAYLLDGGLHNGSSSIAPSINSPGTIITILSNEPTKDGYTFDGWLCNIDGQIYWPGDTYEVNGSTEFTAQWI